MPPTSGENPTCAAFPAFISTFIDTFVDFSVSGGIFLPSPIPSSPFLTRRPAPDLLVAIGDVHGDLSKLKHSLRLAGLIDATTDSWSGGSSTLVQVGDVLDRGGDEIRIMYFMERLKRQAMSVGGSVITLNGNHEIMNVGGDFRFVAKEGVEEFRNWGFWYQMGEKMKGLCHGLTNESEGKGKGLFEGVQERFRGVREEYWEGFRARVAALRPDGVISRRFLGENVTVLVVGDNVFVHGGLLVNHVEYGLDRINEEVRDWIKGKAKGLSREIGKGRDSLVWSRRYSNENELDCDCETLKRVLAMIPGAKRMVMGHTIQENGINGVCGNAAIRIDVGMSKGCGDGLPEVLEIRKSEGLRVLTSNPLYMETRAEAPSEAKVGLGLLLPEHRPKQVEVRA
ncbi:hypothetical protein Droror1_Dr00007608 [Drosera rotundifolia]